MRRSGSNDIRKTNKFYPKTGKQSEPADLRQGNVVRYVAAPSSVLQRFPLCPIESNGNENFKVIQNPGFLSDHPQNWITGSVCHSRHTLKISERSVQTKSGKNILGGGN